MIHHELKTIFMHIPRTGGTSITTRLNEEPTDWKFTGYSHMTVENAKNNWAKLWSCYFKFAVVRNPYEKVLSSWKRSNVIKEYHKEFVFDDFTDFLVFMDKYEHPKKQNVLGTQFIWLGQPCEMDYIIKFEDFEAGWKMVAGKIGIDPKIEHLNSTDHLHYREYYTAEAKQIVEKYHMRDLEYFNYEF